MRRTELLQEVWMLEQYRTQPARRLECEALLCVISAGRWFMQLYLSEEPFAGVGADQEGTGSGKDQVPCPQKRSHLMIAAAPAIVLP